MLTFDYTDIQPERGFVDELKKPYHTVTPSFYDRNGASERDEASVKGLYIAKTYGEDDVLQTAYDDLESFAGVYGLTGRTMPLYLQKGDVRDTESYRITVEDNAVVLTAPDTEGIRRGIYFLEDEIIRRGAPWLKKGVTERRSFIKTRISRCFFSPRNRSGKDEDDELVNGGEYYPDNYLCRLAHDGTNGLWIYTHLFELVKTSLHPEKAEKSDIRLATLNRIIAKCKRYGIRIYVFFSDPDASLLEGHPEMEGNVLYDGRVTFCTHTEAGRNACIEATQKLFTACPELGGVIDLCQGEYLTTCASVLPEIHCPHCGNRTPGEVLAQTMDCIREGMRRAGADRAECIAWTYGMRVWDIPSVCDYVRHLPKDVVEMQNFEENGWNVQLGKPRLATDYWLSYPGPSGLFKATADTARESGVKMYAKLQVCNSHEVATVPYIPVPGLLFDRYAYCYGAGVSGVMQCWFFGNYPCVMSRAAGELAFETDFDDKKEYLHRLATLYYGREKADGAAEIWQGFEDGYRQMPTNIRFSYQGTMHAGPTWIMRLLPANKEPPATWIADLPTDGDRICDALMRGHTLEEAHTLCKRMSADWHRAALRAHDIFTDDETGREQRSVADALDILFASGSAVLEFYLLREKLGRGGDAKEILRRMRKIFAEEEERGERLIDLCEHDARLGFHSEAEKYQFHPERIRFRNRALKQVLDVEFTEVEKRVAEGLAPLAYYTRDYDGEPVVRVRKMPGEKIYLQKDGKRAESYFTVCYDEKRVTFDFFSPKKTSFTIYPEYKLLIKEPVLTVNADGTKTAPRLYCGETTHYMFGMSEEESEKEYAGYDVTSHRTDGTHLTVSFDRTRCDPLGLFKMAVADGDDASLKGETHHLWPVCEPGCLVRFVLETE